jgi:hypothetical protein
MMTLQQFIEHNQKAIRANFKMRNQSVASPKRMRQIKAQRRKTVRRFIAQLRVSLDPLTREAVAKETAFMTG